ncbi:class I SAM-dependent methyltransferase [Polynucleobacter sp. AP-Mumm-500A-B3]|nr:class I SAM-dependent methyltransferase [Polynucleobacter nymphae]
MLDSIINLFDDLRLPRPKVLDYSLLKCSECELIFSNPMKAGSDEFYSWICNSHYYYPPERWEWGALIELIKEKNKVVLDVGCGSGIFLEKLTKHGISGVGIDSNLGSVLECRSKGLTAECLPINLLGTLGNGSKFDVITLFHVLEHLEDPRESIASLWAHVKSGGLLAISIPLSPMFFEEDWWDPLNRPPHHLTRWNLKALNALATFLGAKAEFVIEPCNGLIQRVASTMQLKHSMPHITGSAFNRKLRLIFRLIVRPISTVKTLLHQLQRDNSPQGVVGNSVLVLLKKL